MVTDENNVIVNKFCGDLLITGMFSLFFGDYALITFHSDSKVQERGYQITFTTVKLSK